MTPFAWLASCVAVVLGGLAWRRGGWSMALAAGAWGLYAAYEHAIAARLICSGDCNIRVDLLLIWPVLGLLTLVAVWRLLRGRANRRRAAE